MFQARDHRGLVAIKSPGTAAPHAQGRSEAEDGEAAILLFREEPRERRGRRLPLPLRERGRVADRISGADPPEQGPWVARPSQHQEITPRINRFTRRSALARAADVPNKNHLGS